MPKLHSAFAAAVSAFLLAACAAEAPTAAQNNAVEAEAGAPGNAAASEPDPAAAPANGSGEPVPPPDAVSHPNGYLPDPGAAPAPAEPAETDAPRPETLPPATEDQYIRNGQSGR